MAIYWSAKTIEIRRFFLLPWVYFKSCKQRNPHVMDVTVHQNSFESNAALPAWVPQEGPIHVKVPLWSNYDIHFFIFSYTEGVPWIILPNFNLLRSIERTFFGPLFLNLRPPFIWSKWRHILKNYCTDHGLPRGGWTQLEYWNSLLPRSPPCWFHDHDKRAFVIRQCDQPWCFSSCVHPPLQAPQAQNTWCMRQLVYIENCMWKSPIVK